jgi:subtilisin family serine protease
VANVAAELNKKAEARHHVMDFGLAAELLAKRSEYAVFLPVQDVILDTLLPYTTLDSEGDRWSEREVCLSKDDVRQPVLIGIWDSGIDVSQFPGRIWRNPRETHNGKDDDGNGFVDDIHGPAFDKDRLPSTGDLRPLQPGDLEDFHTLQRVRQGFLDAEDGLDTAAVRFTREYLKTLNASDLESWWLRQYRLGGWAHGTGVADLAQRGNPGARLINGRYDVYVSTIPHPIDEGYGTAMAAYATKMIDYFRDNKAKVVNMSFIMTEPMIDDSLASIEPDGNRRKRRAQQIFATIRRAFEQAILRSPQILFVAGAGNSNENVDTVPSFPAGIRAPNLLTVGAVNSALRETDFTSYGSTVDVYANGFHVGARMPGGGTEYASGTSSAAPMVANVAGKMLAVNPNLSPEQLKSIITGTATKEGHQQLRVVFPSRAVATAKALAAG